MNEVPFIYKTSNMDEMLSIDFAEGVRLQVLGVSPEM